MVDEYQDTNRPQYLLIQRLAARHRNLCVVGDPDQSIYKWRGADLRNILDFEHDFPEAKIVRLERNYRSTQVILDAASAVIAQNRNRKEKRLYTDRAGGAQILYYRAGDDLDEAEFIARHVPRRAARRRREHGRDSVSHQRAVAHARRRAPPIRHRLQDHRRRPVLRAQGNQGRPRLPQAGAEPARRRQPASRHQRAGARHRQGRDGVARGGRSRANRRHRFAAAAGRPAARGHDELAMGQAGPRRRAQAARAARHGIADGVSRPDRRADGDGAARDGVDRARQGDRPERLPAGPARGAQRGGGKPDREPDGARLGGPRIRDAESRAVARGLRRPAVAALRRGRGSRLAQCARADDDDAQREGTGVSDRHHGRPRGGAVPALAVERRRGRARGGAAALLRRDHARATAAGADVGGAPAGVRRLPVHRAVALHRRDSRAS